MFNSPSICDNQMARVSGAGHLNRFSTYTAAPIAGWHGNMFLQLLKRKWNCHVTRTQGKSSNVVTRILILMGRTAGSGVSRENGLDPIWRFQNMNTKITAIYRHGLSELKQHLKHSILFKTTAILPQCILKTDYRTVLQRGAVCWHLWTNAKVRD